MTRREIMSSGLAAVLAGRAAFAQSTPGIGSPRLGLAVESYSFRWQGKYSHLRVPPFRDALDLLDHVRSLGVAGVQVPMDGWTQNFATKVRRSCESYAMTLEGSLRLPQSKGDTGRFESELRTASEAGAQVIRAGLGGRRYEVFTSIGDFALWKAHAVQSMEWAEPVAKKVGVKLAVENHQDLQSHELVEVLKRIASAHLGACVDTGNSLALLEHPQAVVEALAPFAFTVQLKDVAAQETAEGFQMTEVPLGQGVLPLEAMIRSLRTANPRIQFYLEMITRDPIEVPCLREPYWTTFPQKPGVDLARVWPLIQDGKDRPLPRVADLTTEARLELEERNIAQCLLLAAEKLGFGQPKLQKISDLGSEH